MNRRPRTDVIGGVYIGISVFSLPIMASNSFMTKTLASLHLKEYMAYTSFLYKLDGL